MSWIDGMWHRMRVLWRPDAHAKELEEEVTFHLELDAVGRGSDAARRRFGNQTWIREEVRRMTPLLFWDLFRQDVRYAWRSLWRSRRLAMMIVTMLALGVGFNAATFSVLDAVFLRAPSGIRQPNELRRVWKVYYKTGDGVPFASQNISYNSYLEVSPLFDDAWSHTIAAAPAEARVGQGTQRTSAQLVYANANYFPLLGVSAARGRLFAADEDSLGKGAPVVVVSNAYWRTQLGARDDILGTVLHVDRRPVTIIGILPQGFSGTDLNPVDLWMPLGALPSPNGSPGWWTSENANNLRLLLRSRKAGADLALSAALTNQIRARNRERYGTNADTLARAELGSIIESRSPLTRQQGPIIATRLFAVAVLIFCIALANVINLLLARAAERRREVAVRLALGISRVRLAALHVAESLLVALSAGVGATLAGALGAALLRQLLFPDIRWATPLVDLRIALFTVCLSVVAGLVISLPPAVLATRAQLNGVIKTGGRLRSSLVVAQVALSVALLAGAALFVQSLRNVEGLDIGFDVQRIVLAQPVFEDGEAPELSTVAAKMSEVESRVARIPGVDKVGRAAVTPFTGFGFDEIFVGSDSLASMGSPMPTRAVATPTFFEASGIRLLQGRPYTPGTGDGPFEIVINQAMARQVWKGADPLGSCVHVGDRQAPCHIVVGIVENSRQSDLIEREAHPIFYLPLGGPGGRSGGRALIVRVASENAGAVIPTVERELRAAFPTASVTARTMSQHLAPSYRPWRLGAALFVACGALALLVAVLGVYSTVSYSVSQRIREFGIRVALGGSLAQVASGVIRESMRVVLIGIAIGLCVALVAGQALASLLYDVEPSDMRALGTASVLLLVAAVLASALPARRAANVDPARVLSSP